VDKAETSGKYGKPPEYWQQFKDAIENKTAKAIKRKTRAGKEYDAWEIDTTVYRVPNEDVFSQVNTVQKMAQKRALVAATMLAVNASEYYTQDLEDLTIEANFTVSATPVTTTPATPDNPPATPEPEQEPAEPFEGIPTNHEELISALEPLGYYDHGKHMINTLNKINGTQFKSWPTANPQFFADALPQLIAYANENKAQEVVKATAEQMEAPF
jgi:hypothetical protein